MHLVLPKPFLKDVFVSFRFVVREKWETGLFTLKKENNSEVVIGYFPPTRRRRGKY
jgi:hypothetical protein